MPHFEYKVIPAPLRGEKARGAKTTGDRFALALTNLMNELARDGWEYQRADTLPCEERVGFTGKATTFQNMLVFRRELAREVTATAAAQTPMVAAVPAASPVFAAASVPEPMVPRLGAAEGQAGHAPAVGPVRPELAAE